MSVDGHDPDAIRAAIAKAKSDPSAPWLIAAKTVIGKGAPNKGGTAGVHGAPLGGDEISATRETLDWPHAPFEVPEATLAGWRSAGSRHADSYQAWTSRWNSLDAATREDFEDPMNPRIREAVDAANA